MRELRRTCFQELIVLYEGSLATSIIEGREEPRREIRGCFSGDKKKKASCFGCFSTNSKK